MWKLTQELEACHGRTRWQSTQQRVGVASWVYDYLETLEEIQVSGASKSWNGALSSRDHHRLWLNLETRSTTYGRTEAQCQCRLVGGRDIFPETSGVRAPCLRTPVLPMARSTSLLHWPSWHGAPSKGDKAGGRGYSLGNCELPKGYLNQFPKIGRTVYL